MSGPTPRQIAALAVEIHSKRGLAVKTVHQDSRHRFRIALDGKKGRIDIVLDLDPTFPRVHLAGPKPAPASPTPLASILRRNLRAARFEGARAVPGERAVVLVFRRGGGTNTLWFEAFGRRANLYFVGTNGRVVLTPRGEVAKTRGARVGDTFVPVPPVRPDARPVERLQAPGEPPGASAEVEASARTASGEQTLARRRAELGRRLRREVKRAEGRVAKLEEQRAKGQTADRLQREAELLQASFHLLKQGRGLVRVPDHAAPEALEVEIEVDARLEPGEQVAQAFRAARKAGRAGEEAEARLPEAARALEAVRERLAEAEAAPDLEALQALEGDGDRGPRDPRPTDAPRARPWREFRSADGWRILVGKNARANDELTLREARPQDLFLHAQGAGGSHVIVPTPSGKTVPKDTLLDAAQLAMLYSARREAARCEVDYTPRRYVSKPKKAPPGTVRLQRTKTLSVRREEERRTRLGASRRK